MHRPIGLSELSRVADGDCTGEPIGQFKFVDMAFR